MSWDQEQLIVSHDEILACDTRPDLGVPITTITSNIYFSEGPGGESNVWHKRRGI